MIDRYYNGAVATNKVHENEHRIAAAELRRLAKAASYGEESVDDAGVVQVPRISVLGFVNGAGRSLQRRWMAVMARLAPA